MKKILVLGLTGWMANALSAQVKLEGTLKDEGGAAVPFASLLLGDPGLAANTDAKGNFRAGGLFAGELRVRVRRIGFQELDTLVRLQEGNNALALVLRPGNVELAAAEVAAGDWDYLADVASRMDRVLDL